MKKKGLSIELTRPPAGAWRNFAQVPEMLSDIPPPKEKPPAPAASPGEASKPPENIRKMPE